MILDTDLDEWSPQGPVTELSTEHAWALLATQSLGRLALSMDDRPQIFPVDFATDDGTIVFRTAAGAKLRELLHNRHVAFETDYDGDEEAWSVVARGAAEVLSTTDDIRRADALTLPHWVPILPYVYVRIVPDDIRARHFDHRLRAERAD